MAWDKRGAHGAYLVYFTLEWSQLLRVGSRGVFSFPAGRYAYVGSARRGIEARVARHKRLAVQKAGKLHWHIDYLLVNPHTRWSRAVVMKNGIECEISKKIAARKGVSVPVPGFGSTDCRAGCEAHLYLLPRRKLGAPASR